jgi:hypothetical protein
VRRRATLMPNWHGGKRVDGSLLSSLSQNCISCSPTGVGRPWRTPPAPNTRLERFPLWGWRFISSTPAPHPDAGSLHNDLHAPVLWFADTEASGHEKVGLSIAPDGNRTGRHTVTDQFAGNRLRTAHR